MFARKISFGDPSAAVLSSDEELKEGVRLASLIFVVCYFSHAFSAFMRDIEPSVDEPRIPRLSFHKDHVPLNSSPSYVHLPSII